MTDLRGGRYSVEHRGQQAGRRYTNEAGARRSAMRKSKIDTTGHPFAAVFERYDADAKTYVEQGRAAYVGGWLDDERGTMAVNHKDTHHAD